VDGPVKPGHDGWRQRLQCDDRRAIDMMPQPRRAVLIGLAFGAGAAHLAVVGVLLMLHQRWIIIDTLSLGQAALVVIAGGAGAMAGRPLPGVLAGAAAGVPVAALALLMTIVPLQGIFIALSPALLNMLTFEFGPAAGSGILIGGGAVAGLLGAALRTSPAMVRRAIIPGAVAVLVAGVFQELIQLMLQQYEGFVSDIREFLYTWEGLSPEGAVTIFIVVALCSELIGLAQRRRIARWPIRDHRRERMIWAGFALLCLVLLPAVAGSYVGQVLMLVGLYILMGMGLNLEVGLAGLLDLGFVAFFAVGAYTTALLTADAPHALAHLSYWEVMPVAVFLSILVGVMFGLPVLGVRGDYLAVATMGLGEIVRVIVQSDFAAPLLGGAQGILQIPRPQLGSFVLGSPVALFYLTLVASAVAAFVAWRLENSRLGRAWMALRDDEDVAQALGINLIRSKLLAYGLGAAFAGLAGSIFATMLGSVYPSSFQLLISINVLALIIVGGMGSLPGVVLGSIALIGLPELLREFGEYRYLFYGAVLVVMMRLRPEGLWPSDVRQRELHAADETLALDAGTDAVPVQQR
jgi:branched-chain amino acid transport system permease protein